MATTVPTFQQVRITAGPACIVAVPCIRDSRVTVTDYPYLERADVKAALE